MFVVDPIETPEAPPGIPLEEEPDAGGKDDGAENADRLGEVGAHAADRERQYGSEQQHLDDRIAELFGEKSPSRLVARRSDDIVAVEAPAFGNLTGGETDRRETDHGI